MGGLLDHIVVKEDGQSRGGLRLQLVDNVQGHKEIPFILFGVWNLFFSCKESLGNFSILCYNFLIFEM